ncbi:hypothetical protein [Aeromonas caviae]|uniref:hypothetical protein n=1 Tax=Aeromonas caviae TaxID=648 RepID=UPI0028DF6ECB|nr:hypothetical protein [Aeromonas caviae]MDT8954715.1 hypothetical protein [Aeromonas caviae]
MDKVSLGGDLKPVKYMGVLYFYGGDSPFKPDREHLHHIFQRIGFGPRQTLVAICSLAAIFATFGIFGEAMNISESVMFYSFIALFGVYFYSLVYIWRITSFIRRAMGKEELEMVNN